MPNKARIMIEKNENGYRAIRPGQGGLSAEGYSLEDVIVNIVIADLKDFFDTCFKISIDDNEKEMHGEHSTPK